MRLLQILALLVLLASAPALAVSDYDYCLVRPGDTVESIAAAHGLEAEVVVYCNRGVMGEEGRLEPGMVLTLPKAEGGEAGDQVPSAASPRKAASASSRSALRGGGRISRSGGSVTVVGSPTHVNRYVGSDGRAVAVPTYVPPVDPAEEEAARRGLASRSGRPIRAVLACARRYLGVPYVWGGESASGFDCSGFVMYVFQSFGVRLPRTADVQFAAGRAVPRGQEQPGDLVFFETYAPGASHVGIYLGATRFIHASSVGFVRISSLQESFFQTRYLGARRVL